MTPTEAPYRSYPDNPYERASRFVIYLVSHLLFPHFSLPVLLVREGKEFGRPVSSFLITNFPFEHSLRCYATPTCTTAVMAVAPPGRFGDARTGDAHPFPHPARRNYAARWCPHLHAVPHHPWIWLRRCADSSSVCTYTCSGPLFNGQHMLTSRLDSRNGLFRCRYRR